MLNFLYRWLTFHVFLQVADFFYNDRILGQAGRKIGESVGSISRGPTPVYNNWVRGLYHDERVQIDWQRPLSGVHSFIMVNSAQPDEGGVARLLPFTLSTIMSKVVVYAPAEREDKLLLFLLYPFLLCGLNILYAKTASSSRFLTLLLCGHK